MSVIAMKVKTAADVEDSKNLRVYDFEWGGVELTIVANRTNVYKVGDIVAVAQVGTKLGDLDNPGSIFEITQRKVFGIESFGMALGDIGTTPLGTKLGDSALVAFKVMNVESEPHINNQGQFQSDKYPTTPPDCVPLKVTDTDAQDLLWEYASRRSNIDKDFCKNLQKRLLEVGYQPPQINFEE